MQCGALDHRNPGSRIFLQSPVALLWSLNLGAGETAFLSDRLNLSLIYPSND